MKCSFHGDCCHLKGYLLKEWNFTPCQFHIVKNVICPFLILSAEIPACKSLLNNTFNCLYGAKWSIKSVWGSIHSYQNSSLEKISVLFYGTCLLSKCHLALRESWIVTFQGNE